MKSSLFCCALPAAVKFYIFLICIPQLLWLLSNRNGILAVCESCSSNSHFFLQQILGQSKDIDHDNITFNTCSIANSDGVSLVTDEKMYLDMQSSHNMSSLCMCSMDGSESMETLQLMEGESHGGWYERYVYLCQ